MNPHVSENHNYALKLYVSENHTSCYKEINAQDLIRYILSAQFNLAYMMGFMALLLVVWRLVVHSHNS